MADDIEVIAGADDVGQVDFGGDEAGCVEARSGQHVTQRTGNQTASANQRSVAFPSFYLNAKLIWRWLHLARADDEASPLVGDVAHRALPDVAFINGWRAPDVEPFGVHGGTEQWHMIFPADRRADAASGCFDQGQ